MRGVTVAMIMMLRDFGPYTFCLSICWLGGNHFLLRDFVPYGIIFIMCVVTTVAMAMLLKDFEPYGVMFMNACCYNRCHGNASKGFRALWDNICTCVVTTVAMAMLLRDVGPYGIIFMIMCVY
jgi:uncharacterized YccA/Bax inhibitor family protein